MRSCQASRSSCSRPTTRSPGPTGDARDKFEAALLPRRALMRGLWIGLLEDGVAAGAFHPGLDNEVVYRFIWDTGWVAVRRYRPGGELSATKVADQYLSILLDGHR